MELDYLKSRKNAYAALLTGFVFGLAASFLIFEDPDASTVLAAGAVGVAAGEAVMFWRWRKEQKNPPENGKQ